MGYFGYFVIIVSFFDTFSQLPIMSPFARELGGNSLIIGLVIGMYSFSNMIGNIFAGHLIDAIGRKKIIVIGMVIAGSSLFIYSLVASAIQLLVVRFIHGIGGALLVPAAFAYLGDRSGTGGRGRTMALSGAAIGIAALLGPAFGGLVKEQAGINAVFYVVAILMLATAVLVYLLLPEYYQKCPAEKIAIKELGRKLGDLLKNNQLVTAYLAAFCLMYAQGILAFLLPLKMELLGYGSAVTGMLISVFAIMAILVFAIPVKLLSDKVGRFIPIMAGIVIIFLSLLGLNLFSNIYILIGVMMNYGIGFAFVFAASAASVLDNTQVMERGRAFGLYYAFFSLGVVVGPLLIGLLDVTPDNGFIIGSLSIFIIGLILYLRRILIPDIEYDNND